MTRLVAEFGTGQFFWSMLWISLVIILIWLLIAVFVNIFRSQDLSGWAKALWVVFVVVFPFLGVFVYLAARGASASPMDVYGTGTRTGRPGPV